MKLLPAIRPVQTRDGMAPGACKLYSLEFARQGNALKDLIPLGFVV
jgi:hypothetical protein